MSEQAGIIHHRVNVMLLFDNSEAPALHKLALAVMTFYESYSGMPSVVRVHPSQPTGVEGGEWGNILIVRTDDVLPNHYEVSLGYRKYPEVLSEWGVINE